MIIEMSAKGLWGAVQITSREADKLSTQTWVVRESLNDFQKHIRTLQENPIALGKMQSQLEEFSAVKNETTSLSDISENADQFSTGVGRIDKVLTGINHGTNRVPMTETEKDELSRTIKQALDFHEEDVVSDTLQNLSGKIMQWGDVLTNVAIEVKKAQREAETNMIIHYDEAVSFINKASASLSEITPNLADAAAIAKLVDDNVELMEYWLKVLMSEE